VADNEGAFTYFFILDLFNIARNSCSTVCTERTSEQGIGMNVEGKALV
jgi:hypothetical protein